MTNATAELERLFHTEWRNYHSHPETFMQAATIIIDRMPTLDVQFQNKTTPLITACHYRLTSVVKYLLEHGADPNYRSDDNLNSPLYRAINAAAFKVVEILIDHGADVHEILLISRSNLLRPAMRTIFPNVDHDTGIKESEQILELLLKKGLDPNQKDGRRNCQVVVDSLSSDHINRIRILLKYGFDINSTNKGMTMLSMAVLNRDFELFKFLAGPECKANINVYVITRRAVRPMQYVLIDYLKTMSDDGDLLYHEMLVWLREEARAIRGHMIAAKSDLVPKEILDHIKQFSGTVVRRSDV